MVGGRGRSLLSRAERAIASKFGQTPEVVWRLLVLLSTRCISFAYTWQPYMSVVETVSVGPH